MSTLLAHVANGVASVEAGAVRGIEVEDFVSDRLTVRTKVNGENGRELVCDCHHCEGKKKLYVNSSTGLWTCYKCGQGGHLTKLVMDLEHLSYSMARRVLRQHEERLPCRSVRRLLEDMEEDEDDESDRSGVGVVQGVLGDSGNPGREVLLLPETFVPVFHPVAGWNIPTYITKRGISARIAALYRAGYCLRGCGRRCRPQCDPCKFSNRFIVPAHVYGQLVFYQGRTMIEVDPKYTSPNVGRNDFVLGLDEAVGSDEVVVVEGPFDVLGCARAGIPAVALLGKKATPAQAMLLQGAGFERVTILLDPEASTFAARAARVLGSILDVRLSTLPSDMDPGNAPRDALLAAVEAARPPRLSDLHVRQDH